MSLRQFVQLVTKNCRKASFDLYELKTLTATAGDMNVALSWEAYPDARPDEYLISWTSGSSGAERGQMTVEAEASGATVSDLVNDVAYTFSVQPRYTGGLASKRSTSCTPKNARYPVTGLTASAGDKKVQLRWTKPAQRTVYELSDYRKSRQSGYQIG